MPAQVLYCSVDTMDYQTIKWFHAGFALLSLFGFVLRGVLMMRGAALLRSPLVRRLPHVNDSLLFVFGLWLLWSGPWSLATARWLQLKLVLLLLYIGLGFVALHRGRFTRGQRVIAWLAAVVTFLLMLWLARYKTF